MAKYFDRFPLVNYNGVPAKNILAKVNFADAARKDIYSNFEYTLPGDGTRADQLSQAVYNTPLYDWSIYLFNNIVDPYHGMYLKTLDFEKFLEGKYGSVENSKATILFYRNNWAGDEQQITVSAYDDLSSNSKSYYDPVINAFNQVIGYKRKQEDWTRSTNKIHELTLGDVSGLEIGNRIIQTTTGAAGTITNIDDVNNIITVQHIDGEFGIDILYTKFISDIKTISQIISDEEAVFWEPVDAYSYEDEKNEIKRYVSLIKNTYIGEVEKLFLERIKSQ